MKNPNGYGTVFKLSGIRRRPYAIQVTVGYDDNGKQIRKFVSYHTSKKEALEALADYNKNNIKYTNKVTFRQIYNIWSAKKFDEVGESAIKLYELAYKHCTELHNLAISDIRTKDLQQVVDQLEDKYDMKKKLKYLISQIFDYAMKNDLIVRDYSKYIELGKKTKKIERTVFTELEIKKLWDNLDMEFVDTVLILIYTGFRIGELLNVKIKDINLENNYIIGGSKTEAGKNRLVPLHKKIIPLVINRIKNNSSEYLIPNFKNNKMTYSNYHREKFEPLMKALNMEHRIHDTRHTFASRLNTAGANPTAIKNIIGHAKYETTEKVYTHKDIEELKKEINIVD